MASGLVNVPTPPVGPGRSPRTLPIHPRQNGEQPESSSTAPDASAGTPRTSRPPAPAASCSAVGAVVSPVLSDHCSCCQRWYAAHCRSSACESSRSCRAWHNARTRPVYDRSRPATVSSGACPRLQPQRSPQAARRPGHRSSWLLPSDLDLLGWPEFAGTVTRRHDRDRHRGFDDRPPPVDGQL